VELRQPRHFLALVEERSITRAASRELIVQSGLSNSLQAHGRPGHRPAATRPGPPRHPGRHRTRRRPGVCFHGCHTPGCPGEGGRQGKQPKHFLFFSPTAASQAAADAFLARLDERAQDRDAPVSNETIGAQLSVYPDSGHSGIFQYHDLFVAQALEFLRD
jgi:hypothetical protein